MTIDKLIALAEDLTPIEQNIAQYILENKDDVINFSIQTVSEILFVSKSSILRFCKKLGFHGFNDFKVQLAKESVICENKDGLINVNYPFEILDTPREIADNLLKLYDITIKDTFSCIDYEKLDEISKILNGCQILDIYTHAHNANIAQNFRDKMLTIGKKVNCIESFYEQRLNALASDSSHVAVILSYSGKASWILTILKKLKEKNITVILIGRIGSNLYPGLVSHYLGISNLENLRNRISQFSSHIALQYMMDVLYSCIYNLDYNKNTRYIQNSIEYMDDRNI